MHRRPETRANPSPFLSASLFTVAVGGRSAAGGARHGQAQQQHDGAQDSHQLQGKPAPHQRHQQDKHGEHGLKGKMQGLKDKFTK